MKGNSGRTIGRILGISKNMCLYWVKKYTKEIKPKSKANGRAEVIEMDELYSFVNKKNKIYIMTLISRDKCQIVEYDIASDRSQKRIQKLVDNSIKASKYYSDTFPIYKKICHKGEHFSLKNKRQTYVVEGVNSDIRKYIPYLQRSFKCFFNL